MLMSQNFREMVLRPGAYETTVAEKFQAMVDLGMANSRMKDYYALWTIGQAFEIDRASQERYLRHLHGVARRFQIEFWTDCRQRSRTTLQSVSNERASSAIRESIPVRSTASAHLWPV